MCDGTEGVSLLFSFLTFSHPSIFSLFLSLLLGLESTLIREPRESAWLHVATAKDENAGGLGGAWDVVGGVSIIKVLTHTFLIWM